MVEVWSKICHNLMLHLQASKWTAARPIDSDIKQGAAKSSSMHESVMLEATFEW